MTSTTTATGRPTPAFASSTVDRFVGAVASGKGIPTELLAPDVVFDATVPGWRYTVTGAEQVAAQYGKWFRDPATFEELNRHPIRGGEVVTYFLRWTEGGVPHAAHHCHVLHFDTAGRIARDKAFCGGRWDADLLAEMAAARDAG